MNDKRKSIDGISKRRTQTKINNTPRTEQRRGSVGVRNNSRVEYPRRRQEVTRRGMNEARRDALGADDLQRRELGDFSQNEAIKSFLGPIESLEVDKIKPARRGRRRKERASIDNGKKPKKRRKKLKIVLLSIFLLLLGGGAWVLIWGNNIISKITGGESGIWDVLSMKEVELKKGADGRTNVLIFGTSGYDMGGSGHDGAQLTDSIMVVSFDKKTNDVAMLSLPRDLKVSRTCTATGKINELYWCNNKDGSDEAGGATALKKEVEKILGISIQYRAHLNWGALVQLVDNLGGITVTLDEDIQDSWTKTYITANQPVQLDGERALGLARARHGTTSGDFSRGNSQQKILIGIKDKLKEKGLGASEAINILNILGDNLRMDFNLDEIKTAYGMTEKIDVNNIRQIGLINTEQEKNYMTTGMIGGISYVLPVDGDGEYERLQSYVRKSLASNNAVAKEEANVMILNGSGVSGVASAEKKKLEKAGYTIGKIGDAPQGDYEKPYYIYDLTGKKPATKKALAKKYHVKVSSGDKLPQGIYGEGYDFVIIIGGEN